MRVVVESEDVLLVIWTVVAMMCAQVSFHGIPKFQSYIFKAMILPRNYHGFDIIDVFK